jgi:hemerythrin-like domain-containing protein
MSTRAESRDLFRFLREDHDVFTQMAEKIIQTIVEGDREDVSDAVSALEAGVLMHLENEERELIPRFAQHDPEEAKALLQDHATIRTRLTELDVSTDLHLVRADAVRVLLDALRAHAERENAGLYRWAERELEATKSASA